jgi:hypothetical protein
VLSGETAYTNFIVLDLTWAGDQTHHLPHSIGEYANHYITDVVVKYFRKTNIQKYYNNQKEKEIIKQLIFCVLTVISVTLLYISFMRIKCYFWKSNYSWAMLPTYFSASRGMIASSASSSTSYFCRLVPCPK